MSGRIGALGDDDSSRVHFGVRWVLESLFVCRTPFPLPLTIEDTFRWGV